MQINFSENFQEKLLLEDLKQKYENFRWYGTSRLSINRFFFIFFVVISGLIGYFLSPDSISLEIGIPQNLVVGIVAFLAGIIGSLLIWTNICLSYGVDDSAWVIEHYQKLSPKALELIKYAKDESYPRWINPNRLQLSCMALIVLIFVIIGLILVSNVLWLFVLFIILFLTTVGFAIFHYVRRKKFKKKIDIEFGN